MADIKSKLTARSLVTSANPLPKTGNDVRFYSYDGSEPDATKDRQIYKRDLLVSLLQSGAELSSPIADLTDAEKAGFLGFVGLGSVVLSGSVLPPNPISGQAFIYSGATLRALGAWGAGVDLPSGLTNPRGAAFRANGDLVVVHGIHGNVDDRVYTRSNGVWDGVYLGVRFSTSNTYYTPESIVEDLDGLLLIGGSTAPSGGGTQSTFLRKQQSDGTWATVTTSGTNQPFDGLAVASDGAYWGAAGAQLERLAPGESTWEQNITPPTPLHGLTFDPDGKLWGISTTTDKLYRLDGQSWTEIMDTPSGDTNVVGVAIDSSGAVTVIGYTSDKLFTTSLSNPIYPRRTGLISWDGTAWNNI